MQEGKTYPAHVIGERILKACGSGGIVVGMIVIPHPHVCLVSCGKRLVFIIGMPLIGIYKHIHGMRLLPIDIRAGLIHVFRRGPKCTLGLVHKLIHKNLIEAVSLSSVFTSDVIGQCGVVCPGSCG